MKKVKKSPAIVKRVFVPVITHAQLEKVGDLLDRLEEVTTRANDISNELNASLAVLRGENHPEGWMEIVEMEE